MRLGFFGGSFDPPHRGHLALALAAADQFSLDRVLLAPVGVQPLKEHQPATDFLHRYAMTALAAQADPRLQPSLLDAPQPDRPNYTVETLARLRASLQTEQAAKQDAGAADVLFTLLGADSILDLRRWRQPERLLSLCDWIVATRPGYAVGQMLAAAADSLPASVHASEALDPAHGAYLRLRHESGVCTSLWFLPDVQEDVSATGLRTAISAGAWDTSLLPAPVAEYILKTGLYRAAE